MVSLIKREASSWSRENIRSLINDMHFMMLAKPLASTRIVVSTTGKDPVLTTVAGTYSYLLNSTTLPTIGTDQVMFVDRVYTGEYDDPVDVDCSKMDGDYTNPAKIVFNDDPGTTTTSYSVRCYKLPKAVSSETVEMDVRQDWHLRGVYEGVMGWIEKTENGRSERWENFINVLLPLFWYECNKTITTGIQRPNYKGGY